MVYFSLPFAVITIYASLERWIGPWSTPQPISALAPRAFRYVTLAQTLPGVVSAAVLTFVPLIGMFFVPMLMGDASSVMIAPLIANQMQAFQLGLGAALVHRGPGSHGRAGTVVALSRSGDRLER